MGCDLDVHEGSSESIGTKAMSSAKLLVMLIMSGDRRIHLKKWLQFVEDKDSLKWMLEYLCGIGMVYRAQHQYILSPTALRMAMAPTRASNQKMFPSNKRGFNSVNKRKGFRKWRARYQCDKKLVHIGYFITKEDAAQAIAFTTYLRGID